jgi:hypothetical protein
MDSCILLETLGTRKIEFEKNNNVENIHKRKNQMKHFLVFFSLLLCSSITLFGQTSTPPSNVGDSDAGTSSNPYQIATLNNLYWLSQNSSYWGKCFIQTADINASTTSSWNSDSGFTPIGNTSTSFTGTYDGNNHTISNLYIHCSSSSYIGLFSTTLGATIKKLGLVDANITGLSYVGGFAGFFSSSTLTCCYCTGTITSSSSGDSYVGGLVGQNYVSSGTSTVTNCYSRASVTGVYVVGGIAGDNLGGSSSSGVIISYCYTSGAISGSSSVGGIDGRNYGKATIKNCLWDVSTTGQSSAYGSNVSGTLSNNSGLTTDQMKIVSNYTNAGWDFIGETANGTNNIWAMLKTINNGYPCFLSQVTTLCVSTQEFSSTITPSSMTGYGRIEVFGSSAVSDHGLCWSTVDTLPTVSENKASLGAASDTGAFTVTISGLVLNSRYSVRAYAINATDTVYGNVVGFYTNPTLTTQAVTNITDSSATGHGTLTTLGVEGYYPTSHGICWNTRGTPTIADSYVDLGSDSTVGSFTATMKGLQSGTLYYARAYATCSSGTVYGAAVTFGTTAVSIVPTGSGTSSSPYQISTLNHLYWLSITSSVWGKYFIQTADIDASTTLYWNSGAGFSPIGNGTTSFSGNYNGQDHTISGLYINRSSQDYVGLFGSNSGTILNLGVRNATVNGETCTGKMVGYNTGSIYYCCATGTVSSSSIFVGGFTGQNRGSVHDCYTLGSVTGGSWTGGFAGQQYGSGYITGCYVSGSAPSGSYQGGFVGAVASGGSVSTCYWDNQNGPTKGYDSYYSGGSFGGTGLDSASMKVKSNFGMDFTSIWTTSSTVNNGYPCFLWEANVPTPLSGNGSAGSPYLVSTYNDLTKVKNDRYAVYRVTNDIDASASDTANSGLGFLPIGTSLEEFYGKFHGGGYTISNLYVNRSGSSYMGLFGYADSVTIDSTTLKNCTIIGGAYAGGLAGRISGTVSNCHVQGTITGSSYTGGLAGYATGTVTGCSTSGKVSGTASVGGFLGTNNGTVSSSSSTDTASGNNDVGAFIGDNYGGVSMCYATGNSIGNTVTGSYTSGGLIGYNTGTISNCYATGSASGLSPVGGLVGANGGGSGIIRYSYATGTVSGTSNVGGLSGTNSGTITASFYNKNIFTGSTSYGTGIDSLAMRMDTTFTNAGWDFYGETVNGAADIWAISNSINHGYPSFMSQITTPIVSTQPITSLTFTSATANGTLVYLNSPTPTAYGFCWNTTGTPTIADTKTDLGSASATGTFTSSMTNLTRNTTYYVRTYATNANGTGYGPVVSFCTGSQVKTLSATGITKNSATVKGAITLIGVPGYYPLHHGICWNTTGAPTVADDTTNLGAASDTGTFITSISSLASSTPYYMRAYAITATDTVYGDVLSFRTEASGVNVSSSNEGLKFAGTTTDSAYVTIPQKSVAPCKKAMTLEAWVFPLAATLTGRIIDHSTAGSADGFLLDLLSGKPRILVGTQACTATTALSVNTWYHLAGTFDASDSIRLYINGVLALSVEKVDSVPYNATLNVRIGIDQNASNRFNGIIDEVRIWNTARTQSQIQSMKDSTLSGSETGLAGYWQFDEGTGITAYDKTVNCNDATLKNFLFGTTDGWIPVLRGSGTSASPYCVRDYVGLTGIGTSPYTVSSVYRVTTNIDASASDTSNSGSGFVPMGNATTSFTGTFHGGGHKITNLHINRSSTNYIGLFGFIGSGATVDSLSVGIDSMSGNKYVGGFAGYNKGTVKYCSTSGVVTGNTSVGGLIGLDSLGTVSYSSSGVTTNGKIDIGGLIGDKVGTGKVSYCYATGNTIGDTSSGSYTAGGLVGYNEDTISNCYATGTVAGTSAIGGMVGSNYGLVSYSYAVGAVSGTNTNYVSGFAGFNAGTITKCFYNSDIFTGSTSSGTGLTTAQMKNSSGFAGWDFTSIWKICSDSTYPGLYGVDNAPFAFADTITTNSRTFALAPLLKNDCDIETWRTNLVLKVQSTTAGTTDGGSTLTFPTSIANGFVDTLKYRVGEVRSAMGDTLWGNTATAIITLDTTVTSVSSGTESVPHVFALHQNYPNPFNPTTTITFTLAKDGITTLKIYDILGREVATLVNGEMKAGIVNTVTFNASKLASGAYFSRLASNSSVQVKKLLLLK